MTNVVINKAAEHAIEKTKKELQERFNKLEQNMTNNMEYQSGLTGKIVSVVKWSLFGIGGLSVVGGGLEFFFKVSIQVDPTIAVIGAGVLGAVGCCGFCCLGMKAKFEQDQGKKYFKELRDIHIQGIKDASEESAKKAMESIKALGSKLEDVENYADQFNGSINNAGQVVDKTQQTVKELRELENQKIETVNQIEQKVKNEKEEVEERAALLKDAKDVINKLKKK